MDNLIATLIELPGLILILYFITYYLIPNLLIKKKKYLFFVLAYILCVIGITFHDILINRFVYLPLVDPSYIDYYTQYIFKKEHIASVINMLQPQILLFISLKFLKKYIDDYFEKEKLKSKITETELKMLKSQIHPHFLFNTLNNIYSLSVEKRNGQVSESIAKLSEILRFTLYECKKDYILLEEEIQIIRNYINLEKLRYSNLKVDIRFPKNIQGVYVIPLLLFTFFENSFKHGVSKLVKEKWIKADLKILDNELFFTIANTKSKKVQKDYLNYSQGIGLENTLNRLDIYFGRGNYILDIHDKNDIFEVYLQHKIKKNEV